ncbi:MAG: helix-turn-helix domain-containing protein [Alphaproteobacteria bacterium]
MESGEEDTRSESFALREVGNALRKQRLVLCLSLSEVSKDLRIKEEYLREIEDGRSEGLPGKVYLRGFVRSYAEYLELDAAHLSNSLELGTLSNLVSESVPPQTPFSLSQSPSGLVLIIAGLIAVCVYATWSYLIVHTKNISPVTSDIPKEIAEAVQTSDFKNNDEVLVVEKNLPSSVRSVDQSLGLARNQIKIGSDQRKIKLEARLPGEPIDVKNVEKSEGNILSKPTSKREPNSKESASVASTKSEPIFLSEKKGNLLNQVKKLKTVTTEISEKSAPENIVMKTSENLNVSKGRITIRGRVASWLEIKRKNGAPLISGMFSPGETFVVPRERGILLSTGNAGGIEILLDGELIAPLGLSGSVRRNVLVELGNLDKIIKKP